jgi:hypothetical protein
VPSQTLTHGAVTAAERAQVWDALDRAETWENIIGIERVIEPHRDEDGHLQSFRFETTIGGRPYRGLARVAQRVEGEKLAWSIQSPDVTGAIEVDLADSNGGTMVSVSLTLAMDGFLAAMFFPMVVQALGRGFPQAVEDFAASFWD